jgi:hypothetical protein
MVDVPTLHAPWIPQSGFRLPDPDLRIPSSAFCLLTSVF